MPTLAEATTNTDQAVEGYSPVETGTVNSAYSSQTPNLQPGYSSTMRCPLPPPLSQQPDSQRQFFTGGVIAQTRLYNPPATSNSVTSNTTNVATTASSSGGGSGSGGSVPILKAQQTALNTSSLPPNGRFVGSFTLSKAFQLLSLSTSRAARIQLYGTANAQSIDAYRGLDIAPPAGTTQNIISDIALDTAPFQWTYQDRVGANGNNPQTATIYVTVTNLSSSTGPITVTISYAALVNT